MIDRSTWRDNVDSPADADVDHGAHGVFDDTAHRRSLALWAVTHKQTATALLAAGLGAAQALVRAGSGRVRGTAASGPARMRGAQA